MILFSRDWQLFPTAKPDLTTRNKSFIRLSSVFRLMGVKNHAFILALVNQDLVGVDPHDPHLTEEQKVAIGIECRLNPWYFFREVARAPALGGGQPSQFQANRANISVLWSFFNHVMYILIQPRQTGKSFSIDTLMVLLLNILCANTQINLLTKDDTLRRANVQRIKDIMSELPDYLLQRSRDDTNNGEEITIRRLNNVYITHVPQSSKKNALKLGRGLTSPIFHGDEPPFQPNIAVALPAALAAGGAAIERAKANGTPYGTILTTTAGKRDDPDGRFIYKLLMDSAWWTESFYDAPNHEVLCELIRRNSREGALRINGTFSHRQLGKTDEWLKERLEESIQTGEEANRDFFNIWTAGNRANPIHISLLEKITASAMDPLHNAISKPYNYVTRWYIPEDQIYTRMKNGKFVLALDPSEAGGGDDIGLVMMDIETLEVVCAGVYNETNLFRFAEWICSIIVDFPNITAIIERKSIGAMLLDYLLLMLPSKGIDPFKRLFNTIVQEASESKERFDEIKMPLNRRPQNIYDRYKKAFGFATAGYGYASRSELYSTTLQLAAKRGADFVHDRALVGQIMGLVIRNNRVDHEIGEHDDLVIAWLLCNWLITQGKNLDFYGIDSATIARNVIQRIKNASPEEIQRMQEQYEIRRSIEKIYNLLSKETDEYVCMKLEHQLRHLDKKIILENNEIYSVDEIIKQAKEAKRNMRFNRASNQTYA